MKALILRLLALFGLAPAGHVALAQTRARRAGEKAARLEMQFTQLRKGRDAAKESHRQAAAAAAEWKRTARQARDEAAQAKTAAERASAQTDDWRARAEALARELQELRERLEESRRVATLAREHLMATEVKLDLIEAAIHVLDARTREEFVSKGS
jgi:chromosome segregation ATPase